MTREEMPNKLAMRYVGKLKELMGDAVFEEFAASERLWQAAYERGMTEAQKHGKWIWDDEGFHCSECWFHAYGNTGEVISGEYKSCPNCGARMDGE